MERAATRLAVTLGDPRGIGPEVAAAALDARIDGAELVTVGPTGTGIEPDVAIGAWVGDDAAAAGRLAGAAIEAAVGLALDGDVAGIVTAPIEKAALSAAGYAFPGHTEMLQSLTDADEVAMLMAAEQTALGGPLRVVLATIHIPLAAVPAALTADRLAAQARLTDRALRELWGIESPRLALCALNPHASDSGLFGDEEARIMAPAVRALVESGLEVRGPIPADTVFVRAIRGEFDAVIAPYHDVGMAAFKTASFGSGVNVTLGLPFVRTSPDHGTALDIAGRGLADPASMIEAVRTAARLCRGPEPVPSE
ncbi:MAG: 4-hydroxythreonine-4-phosphate dehydrogenase PdxA [Longimicrobiales bacterium]|nr:4-hydroxythreonine-4-phosphate dehydrogenase PdxA [Longimicrobiales bacterium]